MPPLLTRGLFYFDLPAWRGARLTPLILTRAFAWVNARYGFASRLPARYVRGLPDARGSAFATPLAIRGTAPRLSFDSVRFAAFRLLTRRVGAACAGETGETGVRNVATPSPHGLVLNAPAPFAFAVAARSLP